MSKRFAIPMIFLLTLLVAFQFADFFTAPQTFPDYVKSQIAMRRVESQVQQTFDQGGLAAVETLSSRPISEMGYSFTVSVTYGSSSNNTWIDAFVSLYSDPNEAYMAKGRIFYDKQILAEWNTPYEPPHQTLVSVSTPLRTSNIVLQSLPVLNLGS